MKEKRVNFIGNFFPGVGLGIIISYENKYIYVKNTNILSFLHFFFRISLRISLFLYRYFFLYMEMIRDIFYLEFILLIILFIGNRIFIMN